MWRRRASAWAALAVTMVVVGACIVWAFAVQTLVPNTCELPTAPANAGPLVCPTPSPMPSGPAT